MKQDKLEGLMKEDLCHATWECADIVQNLLPHSKRAVKKVQNIIARPIDKKWPTTRKAHEKDYYSPFAGLLNKTLQASRAALGERAGSYYRSLSFSPYDVDRVTEDDVDGAAYVPKPYLVGCDQEITGNTKVPWHAIRIPVEVKKSWPDIVAQAATYARCMFAASSGRQYALVIGLNHVSTEVRFLFFHRGGLTSSPAFNLKRDDGWKQFIGAMVGLASVKERLFGGMDPSFANSQIALPVGGCWKVDGWLYIGNCIRGCATQIVRVSRIFQEEEPKTARASSSKAKVEDEDRSSKVDSNAGPPVNIERIERIPENNDLKCFNETLDLSSKDIPSNLVVKDSWPLVCRNNEKAMYEAARGLFGVPDVLASYEVKGPDGNPHLTRRFISDPRKYWNVWMSSNYEAPTDPEPEERVQIRHLFRTEGRDLLHASSPHELLEGILHAMIGYLNYYETGYMHRDVSAGNVLLLKQRSTHPAFPYIDVVTDKTECIGVLTDGDHAIRWRSADCIRSANRSGTLPFMSLRLVEIWLFEELYHHTAIDDLESFLWLTVWCIHCAIEGNGKLSEREAFALRVLRSTNIETHFMGRRGVLDNLLDAPTPHPLLALFRPLLSQWWRLSHAGAQEISNLLRSAMALENDAWRDLTHRYFRGYLKVGFSCLADFPQSWEPYFPLKE